MAGAAGGINHPHDAEAESLNGRCEGAIEDELFDEGGRLKEGVSLAGGFGEVLVDVAEEAGVPVRVAKIVNQLPGFGFSLPPEIEKLLRRIARWCHLPERVVLPVEELFH